MELQSLIDFVVNYPSWVFWIVVGGIGIMSVAHQKYGVYVWYPILLMLGFGVALLTKNDLYFYVFCLGVITALAEIIGKFNDEPLKSLGTPHSFAYLILNGLIAAFALKILLVFEVPATSELEKFKIVLAAGLGSMLILRSKLFNLQVGGEDVSFGPEQIIKVFFKFMEAAIDRARAQSRIDLVKSKLSDIDFEKIYSYSLTMLSAAQALDPKDKAACEEAIRKLALKSKDDQNLRTFELGFILLNTMGEAFVIKLFDNAPLEWKIRAPIPDKADDTILNKIANLIPRTSTQYFAYGENMSSQKLREQLGWSEVEETKFRELTDPKVGALTGYSLKFNKPGAGDDASTGLPNIAQDGAGRVEGVLFKLSEEQLKYLDTAELGYRRTDVNVTADGSEIAAQTYLAEIVRDDLRPDTDYLQSMIDGANEHKLSADYKTQLESMRTGEQPLTGNEPT